MEDDSEDCVPEPWYAAKCVFCRRHHQGRKTYEERIVLLKAGDENEALQLAEEEASRYAASLEGCAYIGFVDVFHLFETEVGHGTELYSLIRSSELDEQQYLDTFYDTGAEHSRQS